MPAPAAELAGQLQGALVGLGPGVGEEHLAAAAQQAIERLGDRRPGARCRTGSRRAAAARACVGDRVGDLGVGVAQRRDGEARQEVEVAPALAVLEPRALTGDELDAGRTVGGHDRAVVEVGRAHPRGHRGRRCGRSMASSRRRLPRHHRADAGVGEQLEQHGVGDTPVDQVHLLDAVLDGAQAARDLRDHAARRRCRRRSGARASAAVDPRRSATSGSSASASSPGTSVRKIELVGARAPRPPRPRPRRR